MICFAFDLLKVVNSDKTKTFDFSHLTKDENNNKIINLSSKKLTRKGDIPAKALKDSINVYSIDCYNK